MVEGSHQITLRNNYIIVIKRVSRLSCAFLIFTLLANKLQQEVILQRQIVDWIRMLPDRTRQWDTHSMEQCNPLVGLLLRVRIDGRLQGSKQRRDDDVIRGQYFCVQKSYFLVQRLLILFLVQCCWRSKRQLMRGKALTSYYWKEMNCRILEKFRVKNLPKNLKMQNSSRSQTTSKHSPNCKDYLDRLFGYLQTDNRIQNGGIQKNFDVGQLNGGDLRDCLDLLLQRWSGRVDVLTSEVGQLFGKEVKVEQSQASKKIIKLKIKYQGQKMMDQTYTHRSKLVEGQSFKGCQGLTYRGKVEQYIFYKRILVKIGDLSVIEIIETNSEDRIFFRFDGGDLINLQREGYGNRVKNDRTKVSSLYSTASKLNELLEKSDRYGLIESEDEDSLGQDGTQRSQIVMDDDFYRVNGLISGGRSLCEGEFQNQINNTLSQNDLSVTKWNENKLMKLQGYRLEQQLSKGIDVKNSPNLGEQQPDRQKISPSLCYKEHNLQICLKLPINQVYTRSSSVEKISSIMSASIDLITKRSLFSNYQITENKFLQSSQIKKLCRNKNMKQKDVLR